MALAREVHAGHTERADVRWLMTVARSRFLDHLRRESRSARRLRLVAGPEVRDDPPTPVEVISNLSRLEPIHRLVLVFRHVEDMPVPMVADAIGRNVTATNSLLARARAQLRHDPRRPFDD